MKKLLLLVAVVLAARVLAVPLEEGDLSRVHGVNERMSAKGDPTAASFFAQLLSNLGPLP